MKHTSLNGTGYCVSFQLRKASRAITRLYDAALQPSGIRSTQFTLLVAIAKKNLTTISALGELVVIDVTTLSRSLKKLELMQLIEIVEGADGRERLVHLSAKGKAALAKSLPHWKRIQTKVVSKLIKPGWDDIQKSLERIKDIAQQLETGQ